jgi:TetR/AcrR family transcriptional regulator, cholesterol catabolism regulator
MAKRKAREAKATNGPVSAALIEQEAIRLFGERSYPVVGMRDIGEAVGILPGSLYVHISSKEQLLLKIVSQGIHHYLDAIEPWAVADGPADDRLREIIKAHMRVLATTHQQTLVAFQQWRYLSTDNQERVVDLRRRYETAFRRVIEDGMRDGTFRAPTSTRVAVLGVIGMLTAATNWFRAEGPMTPEEVGDVLADQVLDGFRR